MTIQKYNWISKDTKLNTNGLSVPLKPLFVIILMIMDYSYKKLFAIFEF